LLETTAATRIRPSGNGARASPIPEPGPLEGLDGIEGAAAVEPSERRLRRRYVLRSLRRSPTFLVGAGILLFWVFMAFFSTHITKFAPNTIDPYHSLKPPSLLHWFGSDETGRDVLSRTLAGARTVLIIAPLATLLCLVWGGTIGLVSGYYKGYTDEVIMGFIDVLLALPVVVAAIVVVSVLGHALGIIILVIGILFTPPVSRTIRTAVVAEREKEYVQAARLRGEHAWYIMAAEILPNILSPIIVEGTVRLGYAVFTAATISFLGFGLQPPSPDWGLTISVERAYIQVAWWTVLFPALALASLVVGANLLADGLRKALVE
jgi:peptide/nickel transport system permease protein